jgi:hypothetical protein
MSRQDGPDSNSVALNYKFTARALLLFKRVRWNLLAKLVGKRDDVSNLVTVNESQFSTKFLQSGRDMSDMQLRYHQLCSLASNIPSELRVAPRSTPELLTSAERWLHCLSTLLHRWHCAEHINLVAPVVQRCHCMSLVSSLWSSSGGWHHLLCLQASDDPPSKNPAS